MPDDQLICDPNRQYPDVESCWPIDLSDTQGFTLKEVFGHAIQGSCLSSPESNYPVCIAAPIELDVYTTNAPAEFKDSSGHCRCFSLQEKGDFELLITKQDSSRFLPVSTPPLYAERSITGHGQERGGIRVLLTNPSTTDAVDFVYFESLPWFMKPYIHTLKPSIPGAIKEIYYRPGLDRKRGSQLELLITIPASQTLELSYDFEKAILRYTEYPPDANRGRDVAPAVIRILNSNKTDSAYIRTTPLMLPLPTPDFSMPYNVIILTSTVIALAFGTIYNMLVRQFVGADEDTGGGIKGKVFAGLNFVKRKLRSLKPDDESKKNL